MQNSVISSQLAQVMEYTEIDPATEGFNKAQWKKPVASCVFLVSCFLPYLIAFYCVWLLLLDEQLKDLRFFFLDQ